ncbi:DNA primase [Solibacillus sp. FSL K6-1523]|uniref:DNA primase n=1 Tax=Solibacillus sp. FSL K6-1523 TaxID=2921471 RepID=UPI0030F6A7D7
MIRSVGAGSTGLSNQTRRKTPQEQTMSFPKVGDGAISLDKKEIQETAPGKAPLMVGVKAKAELKSIFDEENGVVKLNADGDSLEVSKRAISIAKEKLFY